jgi:hypothetical protein
MMNSRFVAACSLLLFLTAVCLLPGCNRSDRPATYPVRGSVTYQGKPVAGASVAFLAPEASRPAVATTDKAGSYRLTMFEPNDGAIAGTHVVTVNKLNVDAAPPVPVDQSPDAEIDPAAVERDMQQRMKQQEKARSAVPAKYADRNTSDLRFDVVPGDNEFNIELVD